MNKLIGYLKFFLCCASLLGIIIFTFPHCNTGNSGSDPTNPVENNGNPIDGGGNADLGDKTAPSVSSTIPDNNAAGVPISAEVTITFNEEMDPASISDTVFSLWQGSQQVPGTVTYNGRTASFTPLSLLNISTVYTATMSTGARDLAGNALAASYSWTFTTSSSSDITLPTVTSHVPLANALMIAVDSAISVNFSEVLNPATVTNSTFIVNDGIANISGTVTYNGTTATFTPSTGLSYGKTHTVTLSGGITDSAGNPLVYYSWNFTTRSNGVDLKVESVTLSSYSPLQEGTIDVQLCISNIGVSNAGPFFYGIYFSNDAIINSSDTLIAMVSYSSLNAGANTGTLTKTVAVPGIKGTGDFFIGVIADYLNYISESNEGNNANYDPMKITVLYNPDKPDLVINNVSLSSHSIFNGGTVDLSFQIANTGTWSAASKPYTIYISSTPSIQNLNNYLVGVSGGSGLMAGSSATINRNITIDGSYGTGDFYVIVVADSANEIGELNEDNNSGYDAIKLSVIENPDKPDLIVDYVSLSTYNIIQGDTIDVNLKISNTGTWNSGSFNYGIFLSSDGTIDSSDFLLKWVNIANLAVGTNTGNLIQTVKIPGGVGTGDFYIGVMADNFASIIEANETNNFNLDYASIFLNINPDLWIIATFACNPDDFLYTYMSLFASDGTTLLASDDIFSKYIYSRINYPLVSGNTYYIESNNTFSPSTGCYYLKITKGSVPANGIATKSDDMGDIFPDKAAADSYGPLPLDTDTIHYDNGSTGGSDWFKIVIP